MRSRLAPISGNAVKNRSKKKKKSFQCNVYNKHMQIVASFGHQLARQLKSATPKSRLVHRRRLSESVSSGPRESATLNGII